MCPCGQGPGCEVCPGGRRRLSRAFHAYAETSAVQHAGTRLLSACSGGMTHPGFGQMPSDSGEAAETGCPGTVCVGGSSGAITHAPPQGSSLGTHEAVGTATKRNPAPPWGQARPQTLQAPSPMSRMGRREGEGPPVFSWEQPGKPATECGIRE